MSGLQMDPTLIAGLKEQLRIEVGKAGDARGCAADSRASTGKYLREAAACDARAAQFRHLLRVADPGNAASYADPKGSSADEWSERQALITGARELIDFIEANPEIPAHCLRSFNVYPHKGNAVDDEMGVDQLARAMGVSSGRAHPATHYRASRSFGPGGAVSLEALSCTRTDLEWKEGDPFPDWWPTQQALQAAEQYAEKAARAEPDAAVAS